MATTTTVYTAEEQLAIDYWEKRRGDWDSIKHLEMRYAAGAAPADYKYQCDSTGVKFVWLMTTAELFSALFVVGIRVGKDTAKSRLQDRLIEIAIESEAALLRINTRIWTINLSRLVGCSASIQKCGFVDIELKTAKPIAPGLNSLMITHDEAILMANLYEDGVQAVNKQVTIDGDSYTVTTASSTKITGSYGSSRFMSMSSGKTLVIAIYDSVTGDESSVRRGVLKMTDYLLRNEI